MSGSPKTNLKHALVACAAVAALFGWGRPVLAQDDRVLAEELSNPLAALISVPFFGNYNGEVGTERDGTQWFVNIQPVVPFTLNDDWYVISRTILPVMFSQNGLFPGSGSQSGLRDTTEGLYFSPRRTFNGFSLGAGPIFLLPTATDELLGWLKRTLSLARMLNVFQLMTALLVDWLTITAGPPWPWMVAAPPTTVPPSGPAAAGVKPSGRSAQVVSNSFVSSGFASSRLRKRGCIAASC